MKLAKNQVQLTQSFSYEYEDFLEVGRWCDEHNIDYEYCLSNVWCIPDEAHRTLFILRWGK